MEEKYNISCLVEGGVVGAILKLSEDENCIIEFEMGDYCISVEAENFFYSLIELRKKLEPKNIKVLCKGCSKYVYPSPMILSMGDAIKAYELTLGKQATTKDLVNIFDPCIPDEYASIEEQLSYYNEWKNSRKKL